jgi:hypothetical protein
MTPQPGAPMSLQLGEEAPMSPQSSDDRSATLQPIILDAVDESAVRPVGLNHRVMFFVERNYSRRHDSLFPPCF